MVHAAHLDLLRPLLEDYDLDCAPAVEMEIGEARIRRTRAKKETVRLCGEGERAAINLALARRLILLIDDWKPYLASLEAGVEVISTPVYVVRMYQQRRVGVERSLDLFGRLCRRGTIRPEWTSAALEMIALYRKENQTNEKEKE